MAPATFSRVARRKVANSLSETQGSKNEQIRIRPTLIIGLGGTGGDVIMRIRRRF